MAKTKTDYGIDLGTTNSAICRMENGEPRIIRTDMLKDTMPSCIAFNKRQGLVVGDAAYSTLKTERHRATRSWSSEATNTYSEFKRAMGTDTTYASSYMGRSFSPEELSAEVLKALRSFVTDDEVGTVVITVPAKFTVNQKTATIEAARLAGFTDCRLLQEPIAAAMAYGAATAPVDGVWMVFDFGGGTFDAALLRTTGGVLQVFDTEGDNYLGGKNLDYAIVDRLILPRLAETYRIDDILADPARREVLRDAMKTYAEEAKNHLSFRETYDIVSEDGELGSDADGREIELDMTLTREEVEEVMRPLFAKAVDICRDLLQRNGLSAGDIDKLIPVGGPTHSPLLRRMLREQVTENVDTTVEPMTAVATGAALYAAAISADDGELTAQELQVTGIPLPYNIGIAKWSDTKRQDVFRLARGLEKNRMLPAVGVIEDLHTPIALRPGHEEDIVTIPVYQVDDVENADDRPARLYEYVADVIVSGADIDSPVDENALVNISIRVDSSEQMTLTAHFTETGQSVHKVLDTTRKQSVSETDIEDGITEAERALMRLLLGGVNTERVSQQIDLVREEAGVSSERKAVLQHLKEVLRLIDSLESSSEWERLEKELREEIGKVETIQDELGDDTPHIDIVPLKVQAESVISTGDVKQARAMLEQVQRMYFRMTEIYQLAGFIRYYNEYFGNVNWTDTAAALSLINEGMTLLHCAYTAADLRPVVLEMLKLMPRQEIENARRRLK